MNYEIPAGTAQLINKSKEIAQEYVLLRITPLCLLLSILDNEYVVQLLNKINIKVDSLIDEVKSQINVQNSKTNEGAKDDELMSSVPSTFDTDSTRILHLLTLEDKLAQGKKSGAEIILLSILHDRQNEAKSLLLDRGVSYEKFSLQIRQQHRLPMISVFLTRMICPTLTMTSQRGTKRRNKRLNAKRLKAITIRPLLIISALT